MKIGILPFMLILGAASLHAQATESFPTLPDLTTETVECGSFYQTPVFGKITQELHSDGTYSFESQSDAYTYHYVVDKDFTLISATGQYSDERFVEMLGFSEIELQKTEDGNYIFRGKKKNGRWKEKILEISESGIVYGDASSLFFRALIMEGQGNLNPGVYKGLFPPYPPAEMDYSLMTMPASSIPITLDGYEPPEEFLPVINSDRDLLVIDSGMTGIFAAFYPHRFYYAYETEFPYAPVAFWGGNMGKDDFFILY